MLSAGQITLVQSTFASIALASDQVAATFYERLFELDPSTRALFHKPIPEQGYKLMQMIGAAVMGLDRFDELAPAIQDLGRRHIGYGVKPVHFDFDERGADQRQPAPCYRPDARRRLSFIS